MIHGRQAPQNLTKSWACQYGLAFTTGRYRDQTLLLIESCLRIIVLGVGDTFEGKRAAVILMELLPESGAQT